MSDQKSQPYLPHYDYEIAYRESIEHQTFEFQQALTYSQKEQIKAIESAYPPLDEYDTKTFFWQFPNLEMFSLLEGDLNEIPESLFDLKHLKILELPSCRITEVSPKIKQLVNLTYLDLSSNRFHTLPDEIYDLPNLRFLLLDDGYDIPLNREKLIQMPLEVLSIGYTSSLSKEDQAFIRQHKPNIWMG